MMRQEELYDTFRRMQDAIRKTYMRRYAQNNPVADRSRGQGRILAILKRKDGMSTKDLAQLLNIRISSLNELLAKLEKSEFIYREPSAEDKRVLLIRLTEKGRGWESQEPSENIFACLSDEEQEIFAGYVRRITAALEKEWE